MPNFYSRRYSRNPVLVAIVFVTVTGWFLNANFFTSTNQPTWASVTISSQERALVVIDTFKFAWKGYYENAFPNDELYPLFNIYGNSRNGWGASAVDALGTAIIMNDQETVDQILEFIPTVNFHKTKSPVNLFETTIRYMGGMLSAYELLSGPMQHLVRKPHLLDALLAQSQDLADTLKFAFNTPSGIPWKTLLLQTQESDGSDVTSTVAAGSLILEWTRLSNLTGNPEYKNLVEKGIMPLLKPQPSFATGIPGIVGNWINVHTGEFADSWGSWGPGGDSFYEYLIKMYAYNQTQYVLNKDRWVMAADSVISDIVDAPHGSNLHIISRTSGQFKSQESSHLECFAGGNFILASKVLKDKRYLDFGLKITESCHEMYRRTVTGIGPESITWSAAGMTSKQQAQAQEIGFGIVDPRYQLRPETMESVYYAYRATGDRKYQEWAWEMFVAIVVHTKVRNGFAPLSNVNKIGGGWKFGRQESYFFAELLKYTYLIFAEDAEYQFNYNGPNHWIFNTEAHPIKVAEPW